MSRERGRIKYPENPPLGKWHPPKLKKPLSWEQIKRLWYLRCELQKYAIELKKREDKNLRTRLTDVLRQLDYEFGEYDDYDLKEVETDEANRAWHEANHTLMVATLPLVQSGRMSLEVRLHHWFKDNIGPGYIYRLQAILWYKAVFWGFEKWRDYAYEKYWDKRLEEEFLNEAEDVEQTSHVDKDWEDWYCDYYEQRRLFEHWFQLLGYTFEEALKTHKNLGRYINE